jgi:phosphoribosyl-ATP pyrophosphohydrolase
MSDENDQNIFGTPAPASTENPASPENPFANQLSGILREDGQVKFTTVESALESIPHAQAHIAKVEAEALAQRARTTELEAELNRTKGALEAVEKLGTTPKIEPNVSTPAAPVVPAVDIDSQIEAKVAASLKANADAERASNNVSSVTAALQEKYGETASQKFYEKASEVGLSKEQINTLAATSPAAVLAYFPEVKQDITNVSVSTTSVPATPVIDFTKPLGVPEKSVLFGSDTKDVLAEWQRHGEFVKVQNS